MSDYSIASIRKEFKAQGIFYTPPELAEMLKNLLPAKPRRVYDPTCGRGNLLGVFDDDVEKFGQDVDAAAVADARERLINFHGAVGDVLSNPAFIDDRFDAIVANPPFSIKWNETRDGLFAFAPDVPSKSRADFAFLIHILWMLTDDGTAVVLNSPGIGYRGGREYTIRRWMIEQNYIDKVIHIPGNTFTDTAIATLCLVLKKQRSTTDIHIINQEHGLERIVSLDEVRRLDYTLSVSAYVQKVEEKPTVNAGDLERLARAQAIQRIKCELAMSKLIASIEGWSYAEFIDEIRSVLDDEVDLTTPV